MMLFAWQLLAEQAAEGSPAQQGPVWPTMLPLVAIAVLFYFLMIRPMRRQEKERQSLLSALKKNDKVITSGGIIGIVANINDKQDEVTLKVDEASNVRIRVTRSSITRIVTGDESKDQKDGSA
jgi:preprotein translocase subunit YajC